jgi:beta-glucanase (GH16 family)
VLVANNWGNNYVNYHPNYVALPLGQWFEISANLYQGDRIEWYLNNKKFDTSYNATWPVGRFY